ncbi:ZN414 protein, partial [Rhadina sibilatrix]|nr:ZN414 protein [Rhadina sibilatrix]
ARAARLAGAAAAGVAGPSPLPAAGARPVRALVLDSVLGATPVLGARAVPALRAPLALRAGAAPGSAPPAALPAGPRPPQRLQRRHSSNSRIVWEHTRGRYSCTQCPFSTASREEMTLHIEDHRKNPPPPRLEAEMDFGVGLSPFHTKLPPEMENSLYSQL